jgi:hypothetical protein
MIDARASTVVEARHKIHAATTDRRTAEIYIAVQWIDEVDSILLFQLACELVLQSSRISCV